MRPVNLIPPEERRGARADTRTGPLPYVVVGALVAALAAISAVVLTSNQIADKEAQVAELESRQQTAQAHARALETYAQFAALSEAREATVTSLAQSRFDWERILRELSLVLPDDVWLTGLTGTVSPEVALEGASEVSLREGVTGPALAIVGCAESHEAVARFLESLKDIDGVTRVGIGTDERASEAETSAQSAGSTTSDDCRTRSFISRFEIVAAFDAVPTPAAASAPAAPATTATASTTTTTPTTDSTGIADAQAEQQQATDSAATQTETARHAADIVPGVAR